MPAMTEHPRYAYKLLAPGDAKAFESLGYTNTTLDQIDGYIHLSTKAQLAETFRRYYEQESWCLLLEIDLSTRTDIKWEPSRGGDLFPHIYGKLRTDDVERRWLLKADDVTPIELPDDLND